jgi:fluoride exporter
MANVLVVGLGGFLGAALRHLLAGALNARVPAFPAGTLAVNVLGCFAIGALLGALDARPDAHPAWRLFLAAGVLGGFTTFSAFGHETLELLRAARYGAALASVAGNVLLGLLAVVAGRALTG